MSLVTRAPHRRYKVIQWATGGVGRAAIEGILRHPDLELVGCWVYTDGKHGKDARKALKEPEIANAKASAPTLPAK